MPAMDCSADCTAATKAEENRTIRKGGMDGADRRAALFVRRGRRASSNPVSRADRTWISHSHIPVRTLPNTPSPSTVIRKAGLELLQKVSRRSPSSLDSSPSDTREAAVRAPTG